MPTLQTRAKPNRPAHIVTQNPSLQALTRQLLRADGRSMSTIHDASGLPFYWLKKFSTGEIANPACERVQKLYEFLTGKALL